MEGVVAENVIKVIFLAGPENNVRVYVIVHLESFIVKAEIVYDKSV
jgi:hypothetical protein